MVRVRQQGWVFALALLLAACGGRGTYPDVSEVPERPLPDLNEERAGDITRELEAARDAARQHADEGRRSTTGRTAAEVAAESGMEEPDEATGEDEAQDEAQEEGGAD